MYILTIIIFLAVTCAQYLASVHIAPGIVKYLPEALSGLVAVSVVLAGPRQRFRLIAPRYWILFVLAAAELVCSDLVNDMAPGPLMQGVRFYVRAIPMFFLPAVFEVSETQIRTGLRLLLGISLLQIPLSVYQRYTVYSHFRNSGDEVFGTLMISSIESIFLIGGICIAAALMLRGRMSRLMFFALFVLFVIPTTINETKGTFFLLPIGLLVTLIAGSAPHKRIRVVLSAITLIAVFAAVFLPIYDFFARANNPYPYTFEDFITHPQDIDKYLDKKSDVGSRGEVGRVDSVTEPLRTFSSDPVHLMFGVGAGNASLSSLGNDYTGAYYGLYGRYTTTSSGAAFLIEIGVLGLVLALLLDWLVIRDCLFVARHDNSIIGAVAVGLLGTTVVLVVATFYKELHVFESLSYLFWYYAGVIAAQRMRLELGLEPVSAPHAPVPAAPRRPVTQSRLLR
jgi:hypothetical protein